MSHPAWLQPAQNGVVLKLQIQPKASRSEVAGPHGEPPRLKIRIAAPPVDGEANAELIRFLKKKLGIPAQRIHLIRGETSKSKDVLCEGMDAAQAAQALGQA